MKTVHIEILPEQKFPQDGFNISSKDVDYLLDNAVERCLTSIQEILKSSKHPLAYEAKHDLKDCKSYIVNLWHALQNALRTDELSK